MTATPTRSTAAVWRPGDPVGDRRFAAIGALALERGGVLPDVTVAYETWGTLYAAGDNAVLVEHALTGDSHVVGDPGPGHPSPGWWDGLIGPGRARSTPTGGSSSRATCSVAARARPGRRPPTRTGGRGAAGSRSSPSATRSPPRPRSPTRSASRRWPACSAARWAACGCSSGRSSHPDRVERALVLASTPYATADQIAWCQPQLLAIRSDPAFRGGDYYDQRRRGRSPGMGIARRIAHVTYRQRGRARRPVRPAGRGSARTRSAAAVATPSRATSTTTPPSWPAASTPNSYLVLTEAMNSHDVGRGRGGRRAPPWRRVPRRAARRGVTPTGSTPCGCPRRSPRPRRVACCRSSSRGTATTASSSRPTRWAPSSPRALGDRLSRHAPAVASP